MAKCITNCNCCSLLTWDYLKPTSYYVRRHDHRKAGGILIYKGRVLIVQSRANKWGFPKGGFEQGECALQCATREVLEETSFNVRFNEDDSKVKYKDTIFYVKHLQNKPPDIDDMYLKKPGNDCTGIGWIRLTCLKKLVLRKKKTSLVEDLNNMNLDKKEVMQFNLGVRKFVQEYINKSSHR